METGIIEKHKGDEVIRPFQTVDKVVLGLLS